MGKKQKINTRHKKLDFSYSEYLFRPVRPYKSQEMEPVLSKLFGKNMAEHPDIAETLSETKRYDQYVNEAVTRYIIIRNVGALEGFLRLMAAMIVDKNAVDFSKFFTDYHDFETMLKKSIKAWEEEEEEKN